MSTLPAVPLQVVPGGAVREPSLLETSRDLLLQYAEAAPQWRINRWSFAASVSIGGLRSGRRVLVRGSPLPPLPGIHWVEMDGSCVPAGRAWSPAVEPAVVCQLLALEPGELALLREDGTWDRVSEGDWVRASRSALRRTQEAPA